MVVLGVSLQCGGTSGLTAVWWYWGSHCSVVVVVLGVSLQCGGGGTGGLTAVWWWWYWGSHCSVVVVVPGVSLQCAAGFLCGAMVPDKDGVSAAVVVAEMSSYLQTKQLSLTQQLHSIYQRYAPHGVCDGGRCVTVCAECLTVCVV